MYNSVETLPVEEKSCAHENCCIRKLSSKLLYEKADDAKRKEFEEKLVDAYNVSFHFLGLTQNDRSYIVDIIVQGGKIYKKDLKKFHGPFLEAVISEGGFVFGNGRRATLVDKYVTIYSTDTHRVTVCVNSVKIQKQLFE